MLRVSPPYLFEPQIIMQFLAWVKGSSLIIFRKFFPKFPARFKISSAPIDNISGNKNKIRG